MTTIDYVEPVRDFIDQLDRTEHVTHIAYRKDIVTLHHNGGRLSHEGVMSTWTSREASAHFNVDGPGTVAQFVRLNEYAWATGSTEGNRRSISIEMANETVGPEWKVGDATWREAARLVGWIHARVFGWRPTRESLVVHHYWSATACAGPYVDGIFNQILQVAQTAYAHFTGEGVPSGEPDPGSGPKTLGELADEVIAGKWGTGDNRRFSLQSAGYDYDAVQAAVNAKLEGRGPDPSNDRKPDDQIVDEILRGLYGNDPERRERLIAEGYDQRRIQSLVNARYASGAPTGVRPGPRSVASAVIRGEWDNGAERRRLLIAAGYDYDEIQAEVNRQLGY